MRAPVLAVGDGALSFWNAINEVFPETRHQRCWVHKTANALDSLPKSAQPAAKKAIQDIYNAEDREHAALAMVFKLVESAQVRWRAVNAPPLVALVRAGARVKRGHLVERSEVHTA